MNCVDEINGIYRIYTLSDPRTNEVKYVGRTCLGLKQRLPEHLNTKSNTGKRKWILELKKQGLVPVIETIQRQGYMEIPNLEGYWISQFITWGFDLFNIQKRN